MRLLNRLRRGAQWIVGSLFLATFLLATPQAHAGNYYIDPNYSGVEGAPYTSPGGVSYAKRSVRTVHRRHRL